MAVIDVAMSGWAFIRRTPTMSAVNAGLTYHPTSLRLTMEARMSDGWSGEGAVSIWCKPRRLAFLACETPASRYDARTLVSILYLASADRQARACVRPPGPLLS